MLTGSVFFDLGLAGRPGFVMIPAVVFRGRYCVMAVHGTCRLGRDPFRSVCRIVAHVLWLGRDKTIVIGTVVRIVIIGTVMRIVMRIVMRSVMRGLMAVTVVVRRMVRIVVGRMMRVIGRRRGAVMVQRRRHVAARTPRIKDASVIVAVIVAGT